MLLSKSHQNHLPFMKQKISRVLLVALSAILVLSSCSKAPEQSKYIPKEASFVASINTKQLEQKLLESGLSNEKILETISKTASGADGSEDTSNPVTKGVKDFQNSGVDLKGTLYFFSSATPDGKMYYATIGKLTDASKFEAYVTKNIPNVTVTTADKVKIGIVKIEEGTNATLAWDDKTVMALISPDFEKYSSFMDTDAPAVDNSAVLTTEVKRLFNLKDDEKASSMTSFKEFSKENADIAYWANIDATVENSLKNMPGQAGMAVAMFGNGLKKLIEGSFYISSLNFEKGKVVAKSTGYYGKELKELLDKHDSKTVDIKQLEKYPSDNVFGYAIMAFDTHLIGDLIKALGYDSMIDMQLTKMGITMNDIMNAFNAEIAVIGSDFTVKETPSMWDSTYTNKEPSAKWLFTFKIGDEKAFDKLISLPDMKDVIVKEGDKYILKEVPPTMGAKIEGKDIIIGSSQELVDNYATGKSGGKISGDMISNAKGNVSSMYIDFQKLSKNVPASVFSEVPDSLVTDVKGLLKELKTQSGTVSGGKQVSTAELTFVNQDENSLAQIIKLCTKAYGIFKQKQAAEAATWSQMGDDEEIDTAVAPPAATNVQ